MLTVHSTKFAGVDFTIWQLLSDMDLAVVLSDVIFKAWFKHRYSAFPRCVDGFHYSFRGMITLSAIGLLQA